MPGTPPPLPRDERAPGMAAACSSQVRRSAPIAPSASPAPLRGVAARWRAGGAGRSIWPSLHARRSWPGRCAGPAPSGWTEMTGAGRRDGRAKLPGRGGAAVAFMRAAYGPLASRSRTVRPPSGGRKQARPPKVLALEQQRQGARPGKGAGGAVAQVERSRCRPLPKPRNASRANLACSLSCAATSMPARAIRASGPAQAVPSPVRPASTMLVPSKLTAEGRQRSAAAMT